MPTANIYKISSQSINITLDGSTNDIDLGALFPAGLRLQGVGFVASDGSDVLIVKDKNDSGNTLVEIFGSDSVNILPPINCFPYLDYSACTFGTPANCKIILYYA